MATRRTFFFSSKDAKPLEVAIRNMFIEYIHMVSDRTNVSFADLFKVFFAPKKKPKKVSHVILRDSLIHRLNFDFPRLDVKINENNLFEHNGTGFIISQEKDRFVVIGKVDSSDKNSLLPLTLDDIEKCKEYNLFYDLPDNLVEQVIVKNKTEKKSRLENLYNTLKFGSQSQDNEFDGDDEEEEGEEEE